MKLKLNHLFSFLIFLGAFGIILSCSKKKSNIEAVTILPKDTVKPGGDPPPTDTVKPGGDIPGTVLVHPGLLDTKESIVFFVSKVNAGQEPWLSAYEKLKSSGYASLSYQYKPYISVDCGLYNNPNVGCDQQVFDGFAVYCQALVYLVTKDQRYAVNAIKILTDWSKTYQKNTQSNSRLVVSWAAPWYANGAEILRYNYPGWTKANTDDVTAMFNKFLPYVTDDTMSGNNWVMSSIEAHMAIAVFTDNKTMLDAAVERWKVRVKTYIYQKSDGPVPITIPGKTASETAAKWKDAASSTSYIDGMGMETCRDLDHLKLGYNSIIYAAETAWNQKIDLFSLEKKRLSDFMELHGSWMTGSKPIPSNVCGGIVKVGESDVKGISPPTGGGAALWEIAYGHLHNRLKVDMPYTLQMINSKRPGGVAKWNTKAETLTHADLIYP